MDMKRVCEVCGKEEEFEHVSEQLSSYEIVNVCDDCTEHLVNETHELEG